MVAAEQPEGVEDPAEDAGDGGLAGAGGAGEDEVPFRRLHRQALPGAQPGHVQLRGQRLDLALDRLKPHHALQLGERLLEQAGIGRPGRQGAAVGTGAVVFSRARSTTDGSGPGRRQIGIRQLEVASLDAEEGVEPVGAVQHVPAEAGERDRREVGGVVVSVALGDGREPGRGVHEGGVDAVHRAVEGERRGGRPVPSWARASQYRSSLRCGCSLRQRIRAAASSGSACPYISSRTRAMPPNRPASMPSMGSSSSGSVCGPAGPSP